MFPLIRNAKVLSAFMPWCACGWFLYFGFFFFSKEHFIWASVYLNTFANEIRQNKPEFWSDKGKRIQAACCFPVLALMDNTEMIDLFLCRNLFKSTGYANDDISEDLLQNYVHYVYSVPNELWKPLRSLSPASLHWWRWWWWWWRSPFHRLHIHLSESEILQMVSPIVLISSTLFLLRFCYRFTKAHSV